VEAFKKGLNLRFNSSSHFFVTQSLNVFFFIFFIDKEVLSIFFEFFCVDFAEFFFGIARKMRGVERLSHLKVRSRSETELSNIHLSVL